MPAQGAPERISGLGFLGLHFGGLINHVEAGLLLGLMTAAVLDVGIVAVEQRIVGSGVYGQRINGGHILGFYFMLHGGGQRAARGQGGRGSAILRVRRFGRDRSGTGSQVALGRSFADGSIGTGAIAIATLTAALASAETITTIAAFMSVLAAATAAFTAIAAVTGESVTTAFGTGTTVAAIAVEAAFTGRAFCAFGTGRTVTVLVARGTFAAGVFGTGAAGGSGSAGSGVAGRIGAAVAFGAVNLDGLEVQLGGHLLDYRLFQEIGDGADFHQQVGA